MRGGAHYGGGGGGSVGGLARLQPPRMSIIFRFIIVGLLLLITTHLHIACANAHLFIARFLASIYVAEIVFGSNNICDVL